jgi:glucose-1-phosphate cytidylyltransferase
MKTVILAGGAGLRMNGGCGELPKPLADVGGYPVLYHIMSIYRAQGFDDFIIAGGYKWETILDYCGGLPEFKIRVVDTGLSTMTGGRLLRLKEFLEDEEDFMMTYGDGVSDIDLNNLLSFHRRQGRIATVTAVNPPCPFGRLYLENDRVARFQEKTTDKDLWINGGFFVFKPAVFSYLQNDDTILEREPLEALAAAGELAGYQHTGFWKCMDTMKDRQELQTIWEAGRAPWKVRED